MITLSEPPRRATLRAFGLAVAIVGACVLGVLAWLFGRLEPWSAAAVAAYGVLGVCVPDIFRRPYQIWNRAARLYARLAESCVVRAAYFAVIVPAGWGGSSLKLERPPHHESLWLSRHPAEGAGRLHPATAQGHWLRRYLTWAWEPGHRWRLALVPFLVMLSWLKPEETPALPDNLYTLY